MSQTLESVLDAARQLPLEEQRQLATRLLEDPAHAPTREDDTEANLQIVERTYGTIKGVDRATIIQIANDEEFCGY